MLHLFVIEIKFEFHDQPVLCQGHAARMSPETFSAIIITGAAMLAFGTNGMTDASITLKPLIPSTLNMQTWLSKCVVGVIYKKWDCTLPQLGVNTSFGIICSSHGNGASEVEFRRNSSC